MAAGYTKPTTVAPETRVHVHSPVCGLGNRSTLVEVRGRKKKGKKRNLGFGSEVTVNFFCFKSDHSLSVTLTKC